MFSFLKNKIKSSVSKISQMFEKEANEKEEKREAVSNDENIGEKKADKLASAKEDFVQVVLQKAEKPEIKPEIMHEEKAEKKKIPEEDVTASGINNQNNKMESKSEIVEEKKEDIQEQKASKVTWKERFFGKKKETKDDKADNVKEVKDVVPEVKKPEVLEKKKEIVEEKAEDKNAEQKEEKSEKASEKKSGFFDKIKEKVITTTIGEDRFDEYFQELELGLLENNVALEVVDKIKDDLKAEIVDKPINRFGIEETITNTLKKSIEGLFDDSGFNVSDIVKRIKEKKPFVICFVGINGSGKTTTVAKVARLLKDKGLSVVVAAADTFRAASIEQLEKHCETLGIKIVKQNYGSDPAAVAFDAIQHAKAKNSDVVLIDTAGRMHSNVNLVNEMKKIIRVANPDMKIFIGESITGNDCIEQARIFNDSIGIDGIILTKADIDEKGGTAISIGYVTKKPIIFIGVGQDYQDLKEFDKGIVLDGLGI